MKPNTWMQELQEIKKLTEEFAIENSGLNKELESISNAQDEIVVLLFSRRALEVIITELCLDKLCRQRGTEPLKAIIDRFLKERIVPDYICTSMQNLNSTAVYGAHPKEFDSRQVRTSLMELVIILIWYFKEKGYKPAEKLKSTIEGKKVKEIIKNVKKPKINSSYKLTTRTIIYGFAGIIGIGLILLVAVWIINFDKTDAKSIKKNDTVTNTHTKGTEQFSKGYPINDTIKKSEEAKNTNLTKQVATLPLKIEKKENPERKGTSEKMVISGSKKDIKIDLGNLLQQVTDKQLSFSERKATSLKMKLLFDNSAKISISIDSLVVDRKSVDEYISRLLTLPGLKVMINKQEKNTMGKITKLDVTEKK